MELESFGFDFRFYKQEIKNNTTIFEIYLRFKNGSFIIIPQNHSEKGTQSKTHLFIYSQQNNIILKDTLQQQEHKNVITRKKSFKNK